MCPQADALARGLDVGELFDHLKSHFSSVREVPSELLPPALARLYASTVDLNPVWAVRHAVAAQPFVDQAQSLNHHTWQRNVDQLRRLAYLAWAGGLVTLIYYARVKERKEEGAALVAASIARSISAGSAVRASSDGGGAAAGAAGGVATGADDDSAAEDDAADGMLVCRMEEGCAMCSS